MSNPDPSTGIDPLSALALIGVVGVSAQWLAWQLRVPSIVLLLVAGALLGPILGILNPSEVLGALITPLIGIAVAVILFEGGLTLNFHQLGEARSGVRRLVYFGAPIGWLGSALALHYVAGLSWQVSAVFGGIMIVTGPTVIAPLLRQARLTKRPSNLLQWEAIVNDPIGALAAVLAFEVVVVLRTSAPLNQTILYTALGIAAAAAIGAAAGYGVVLAFRRHLVPEFMKISVMLAVLLGAFALSEVFLHESGLLAVTIMGLIIANANLPSYDEIYRFKEHATVLLVSGVFITLTASLDMAMLRSIDLRALLFVLAAIFLVRPVTVLLALAGSNVPWADRILVASTGPRGVILVAVGGLFGEKLAGLGIADGNRVVPTAFLLVAVTVVLHGFTLKPIARALGLSSKLPPGLMIVGGSRFAGALAEAVEKEGVPALVADPNHSKLASARAAGVTTYYGDVLAEAAEERLEFVSYGTILAASDNDAYNTLVASDFTAEFGRENLWQIGRENEHKSRHALPAQLVGRTFAGAMTYQEIDARMQEGWAIGSRRLTPEFGLEEWRQRRPDAVPLCLVGARGELTLFDDRIPAPKGKLISLQPPGAPAEGPPAPADSDGAAAPAAGV